MELDEILLRKQHLQHLESREDGPETPQKAYLTMERDEMIRYIEFLQQRLDEEKRARELSDKRFEEESVARKEADKRVFDLRIVLLLPVRKLATLPRRMNVLPVMRSARIMMVLSLQYL